MENIHAHKFEKNLGLIFAICLFLVLAVFLVLQVTNTNVKGATAKSYKVVVYDDNKKMLVDSESLEPDKVLSSNDITVWPEDKMEVSLIIDPVTDGGAGQKIVIKRAPIFLVNVDDSQKLVRSWGMSVGDVLSGNVSLGAKDIVVPPLDSSAIPGEIIITRINIVETDEVISIAFGTTYQDDYYVAKGISKTITAGVNGQKKRYLKITYKNGVEISRIIIREETVTKPTTQVIKRGLMPSADPDFKRQYWDMMVAAGAKYGVSPLDLFEVASCESHLIPGKIGYGTGGPFYGMYQYQDGLWQSTFVAAGYGGSNWDDGQAQIYATAKYVAKNGWRKWGCKP